MRVNLSVASLHGMCAAVLLVVMSPWSFVLALDLEDVGRVLSDSVKGRSVEAGMIFSGTEGNTPTCCAIDLNGDCSTNGADLSVLLGVYGETVPPGASVDLNSDGLVNGSDLSVLLAAYGCQGSSDESSPPVCP